MINWVIGIAAVGIVVWTIYAQIGQNKKSDCSCSSGCSGCHGTCHGICERTDVSSHLENKQSLK